MSLRDVLGDVADDGLTLGHVDGRSWDVDVLHFAALALASTPEYRQSILDALEELAEAALLAAVGLLVDRDGGVGHRRRRRRGVDGLGRRMVGRCGRRTVPAGRRVISCGGDQGSEHQQQPEPPHGCGRTHS